MLSLGILPAEPPLLVHCTALVTAQRATQWGSLLFFRARIEY